MTASQPSGFTARTARTARTEENQFAIPGVNVVSSSSVNACMEAAKKVRQRAVGTWVGRDRGGQWSTENVVD